MSAALFAECLISILNEDLIAGDREFTYDVISVVDRSVVYILEDDL